MHAAHLSLITFEFAGQFEPTLKEESKSQRSLSSYVGPANQQQNRTERSKWMFPPKAAG